MCYKLVPIKTAVDRANPYDMGRVDPDLMYDMVKTWSWGGSGEDIYHDIETRRNGITYRGNLARLIEQLINEDKLDQAEEIADIAMEQMPVDKFGFYSLLEPYLSAYYEIGNVDKGRALYKEVANKYQENLMYYSTLSLKNQERKVGEDIYLDIQRYRALIDILVVYNDKEFALEETKKFNGYLSLFDELMNSYNEDELPEVPDDIDLQMSVQDTIKNITPEE
jgi:tetratricopeptide (TPR) repeat protein